MVLGARNGARAVRGSMGETHPTARSSPLDHLLDREVSTIF